MYFWKIQFSEEFLERAWHISQENPGVIKWETVTAERTSSCYQLVEPGEQCLRCWQTITVIDDQLVDPGLL